MEEHMATKAVTLAQKSGSGAVVLLPHTSADLVGYEKKNSTATTVKEALDEMNDNFQGEKPGIVKRVETLEEKVQPFTAPTAGTPGKAGLVPAPHPTAPMLQPLRTFGINGIFNTLTMGSFDISWERPDSTNIVLGARYVQPGTSVDAIPYAGDFYCDAWNVPGISEALTGVLIRRDPGTYGMEEEGVRSSYELLYDLSFDAIRFRKTTGGFAAGGAYTWSDWDTVTGGRLDAPCPQAAEGVGQWRPWGNNPEEGPNITLPAGGVWVYFFMGARISSGVPDGMATGIAAGGTTVTVSGVSVSHVYGFCWRIA